MKRLIIEYLPAGLLLMVAGLIVLHAPLTVWLGTVFPDAKLYIKAWKELLIGLAIVPIAVQLWRTGKLQAFVGRPVVLLSLVYVGMHFLMLGVYVQPLSNMIAGLMIDLRYVGFFVAALGLMTLYPRYRQVFLKVGIIGACVVVGFAVIQVFIPKDSLAAIGYGSSTIEPYLTVDKNPDFVRHSSTLRGPNPLGAYAVVVLAGVAAYWLLARRSINDWKKQLLTGMLLAASLVALWVSYSRSAALAAVAAVLIVLFIKYGFRLGRRTWYVAAAVAVVLAGVLYAARDTAFVHNVILHDNPTTGAEVTSNTAHVESFAHGLERMMVQPLGAGVGSTGSASLLQGGGLIIENQYLMIAHEVGWLGVAVFLVLYGALLHQLWIRRSNWLAAALFASGVGLALIGVLLPVWADDTVSIVWWGLAAVALTGEKNGQNTANQKAKRTA